MSNIQFAEQAEINLQNRHKLDYLHEMNNRGNKKNNCGPTFRLVTITVMV